MIQCGPEICRHLETALQHEWLETNGLGGFASSTILGLNTRRYHGLLTAATQPPVGRLVLLSKLEATLTLDGHSFPLATNHYPGVVHPQGYQYLTRFRLDPFPIFTYRLPAGELEQTLFMVHGENSTVVHYRFQPAPQHPLPDVCRLELRALLAFRDYHSVTHANAALNATVQYVPGLVAVTPYAGLPTLYCAHNADTVDTTGWWSYNFEYAVERERGLDWHEDLFSPFALSFDLRRSGEAVVLASTTPHDVAHVPAYRAAEVARRAARHTVASSADASVRTLIAAADHYIVARGNQQTIIAGYHWFSDWGRDTMIALPGLTLATGRAEVARSVLLAFAQAVDRGMLPNRFPDAGEAPEYNTVDATLWFFEAVRAFWQHTGETDFIKAQLYDVLTDILAWHLRGTRYGIHVDSDGLLAAGEPGVQLTWMDAKVGDWVVTPRHGKPVEIQALWYNALRVAAQLADTYGDTDRRERYGALAVQAQASFQQRFWNAAGGCLYDVVDGETCDGSIRPNQILAVSLPASMLDLAQAQQVVTTVEQHLLTPYGLRSLAPADARYRGRYEGDPYQRDGAYHQGTVWGWLLGPFLTAYLKIYGHTPTGRQQALQWFQRSTAHLAQAGLGHVSEIFDGDAPHQPRGCIAQAWSVAELLRAAAALGLLQRPESA